MTTINRRDLVQIEYTNPYDPLIIKSPSQSETIYLLMQLIKTI